MAQYGAAAFWDARYAADSNPYDWYTRYSALRPVLEEAGVRRDQPLLVLGCGTSRLSGDLAEDGYASVTSCDISAVAVDAMRERARGQGACRWDVQDATRLSYAAGSFAAVVDKGTLDSVLCGEGSTANAAKVCEGVSRVLRPGGVFVCVSHAPPEARLCSLEGDAFTWRVTVKSIREWG